MTGLLRMTLLTILLTVCAPLCAAPQDAVVRVTSHGCSATVISTADSRTLLLTCAHAFERQDRYRRIVLDAPSPVGSAPPPGPGGSTLLRVDYRLDLALIELRRGPLSFVLPVAPAGHRPGRCLSAGYDGMRMPSTTAWATPVSYGMERTYTREIPHSGRSGGALADVDGNYLIGVVQGYEVNTPRRGIYASHSAILRFLGSTQESRPLTLDARQQRFAPRINPATPSCPDGRCWR